MITKNSIFDFNCEEGNRKGDWVLPPITGGSSSGSSVTEFSREHLLRPVMDQGRTSACVGFASAVVFGDVPENRKDLLSGHWIYERARFHDSTLGESYNGTSLKGAAEALRKEGALTEEEYESLRDFPLSKALRASNRRIDSYYIVDWTRIKDIQEILQYESLSASIRVYDWLWTADENGMITGTFKGGKVRGGHNMALTGWKYVDGKLYWRFRNSWGTKFGLNGSLFISHEMILKCTQNRPLYVYVTTAEARNTILEASRRLRRQGLKRVMWDIKNFFKRLIGRL